MVLDSFSFGWPQFLATALTVQRLAELLHSRRNTRALLVQGWREYGAEHYPFMVALHAAWIASIFLLIPSGRDVNLLLLGGFLLLQVLRLWVISSLGPYWTTRIISKPAAPLVHRGPYQIFGHPNYLVVACEIPLAPAIFGAWTLAIVFGVANLTILALRLKEERAALKERPR